MNAPRSTHLDSSAPPVRASETLVNWLALLLLLAAGVVWPP
ncbi:MAG: hypothetical protein ACRETG_06920 [Steroidobacteraceae bacterium]